ncbi:MAG: glycosyltransferase family 2 protein [Alishewanella aestuarii]
MVDRGTICAVVITYNRKELLEECLNAILKQTESVDSIYLIDNHSSDGTPQFLYEKGYIKELPPALINEPWEREFVINNPFGNNSLRFHYVRMHENVGGSGGFYEGVKRAYEKGYDWIWLMDDDAEPKIDCLEKLIRTFKDFRDYYVFTPLTVSPEGTVLHPHRGRINYINLFRKTSIPVNEIPTSGIQKISFTSFVGPLISKNIIKKVGFPDGRFFIYHDDVEYSIRLSKEKDILMVTDSIIIHKENINRLDNKEIRVFFKTLSKRRYNIKNYWRIYYSTRNIIYLSKLYQKSKIKFVYDLFLFTLRTISGIILFDDYKLQRISLVAKAIYDGLTNKLGKRIEPENWIRRFNHK